MIFFSFVPESFHFLVLKMDFKKVEKWILKANSFALNKSLTYELDAVEFCEKVAKNTLKKEVLPKER